MDYLLIAKVILCLAGAAALIYLVILFKKSATVVSEIADAMTRNEKDIDSVISNANKLIESSNLTVVEIQKSIENGNKMLERIEPDIASIANNLSGVARSVNNMTSSVEQTTSNISGKINDVTDNVSSMTSKLTGEISNATASFSNNISYFADSVSKNIGNVMDYIYIAKEILSGIWSRLRK